MEGTEFETLTLNQQMEPHVCQFWEKWEILNWSVSEIKREGWNINWLVQGMEPLPLGMGVQRANHYNMMYG